MAKAAAKQSKVSSRGLTTSQAEGIADAEGNAFFEPAPGVYEVECTKGLSYHPADPDSKMAENNEGVYRMGLKITSGEDEEGNNVENKRWNISIFRPHDDTKRGYALNELKSIFQSFDAPLTKARDGGDVWDPTDFEGKVALVTVVRAKSGKTRDDGTPYTNRRWSALSEEA